jgi:PAS domain S-box-containing protein
MSVFELYKDTPEGKDRAAELFQQFLNGDRIVGEELEMQKADGTPVWISLTVNAIRDADDQIVESRSMVVDITERKLAMATLRESEERYRALADSALDGILMIDSEGKISYWNPSAEKIFGYDSEEVIGLNLHDVILREGCYEEYFEGFRTFIKRGEVPAIHGALEFEAVKKDGTEFPIIISISTFQLNGEWNAVGIIREVTD